MARKSKKNTETTVALQDLEAIEAQAAALEAEADKQAELEQAMIEAEVHAPAVDEADEAPAVDDAVVMPHVAGDLKEMVSNITEEVKVTKQAEVNAEFASRIAFEQAQPGLSSKMVPNLEAAQKKMATLGTAGIFCAIDIDPTFINREVSTGSRFNVYALQKINDLVTALDAGFLQNPINRAMLLSLFNFRDAGVPFNGDAALAAVSDKVKVERAIAKHLVRHTVSANTASTQKSQVVNALQVMGVVTSNKLRGKAEVFTLTDTPQTRRLEDVLRKAA